MFCPLQCDAGLLRDLDELAVCDGCQVGGIMCAGPELRQEDMLQPNIPVDDLDPEAGQAFQDFVAELGRAFDQRANHLVRLLAVINRDQVVDSFRIKRFGFGQELDAVAVWIVNRSRLRGPRIFCQFADLGGKFLR